MCVCVFVWACAYVTNHHFKGWNGVSWERLEWLLIVSMRMHIGSYSKLDHVRLRALLYMENVPAHCGSAVAISWVACTNTHKHPRAHQHTHANAQANKWAHCGSAETLRTRMHKQAYMTSQVRKTSTQLSPHSNKSTRFYDHVFPHANASERNKNTYLLGKQVQLAR